MIKILKEGIERVCQGDLISNVELIEHADINDEGIVEISKVNFPHVVILTQDCDLEQDFNNRSSDPKQRSNEDKHILSIIVAPLYNIEHVCRGEHMSELDFRMQVISHKESSSTNKYLRNNQNPRYHFLKFPDDIPIVDSVIDFKHYFTVSNDYLNRKKKVDFEGKIAELYREQVSHRFASYLSRIGLPNV
jgi:hypothetical protein